MSGCSLLLFLISSLCDRFCSEFEKKENRVRRRLLAANALVSRIIPNNNYCDRGIGKSKKKKKSKNWKNSSSGLRLIVRSVLFNTSCKVIATPSVPRHYASHSVHTNFPKTRTLYLFDIFICRHTVLSSNSTVIWLMNILSRRSPTTPPSARIK